MAKGLMMHPRQLRLVRLLALLILLFLSLPSWARTNLNDTGTSNCIAADFDTFVRFANAPNDYYATIIYKRNISSHPCIFNGPVYGPSIVPDRVPGHPPVSLCYGCERRLPNGQIPIPTSFTLDPNQIAQQTFRWKIKSSDNEACLQPKWMAGPVLIVTPSLLKQICSDIDVSEFSLASAQKPPPSQAENSEQAPKFEITADKSTYYEGEDFPLHVALLPNSKTRNEEICPRLYLRQRSPDGETRIDEVYPLAFKNCPDHIFGHQLGDWNSGFELKSGANSRWTGVGEHSFEVFQLAGSLDDPQLQFASSNILQIQIADPSTMPRQWGPHVKGIAADVTLDKNTFKLGEDVHLHLAIKNFDAKIPLYTWDPLWDPCMTVGIKVQDEKGHLVSNNDRFPDRTICTGHGFGPRPFPKGKVIPIERTLGNEGWLPNHPGSYTVVVTWAPCTGPASIATGIGAANELKTYAVAHAVATIHIVDNNALQPK